MADGPVMLLSAFLIPWIGEAFIRYSATVLWLVLYTID
jgi:hypothetical protein